MSDIMTFPDTFEEFVDIYGFSDSEKIYTNGNRLIQVFRVKQWLDHIERDYMPLQWLDHIERDYMPLPKDADGVPIHVGDTLECHANGYDGVFDVFAVGNDCVVGNHPGCEIFKDPFKAIHIARYCTHYHAPTVEDVLQEFVNAYERESKHVEFDTLDLVEEYAEKLRKVIEDE